MIDIAIHRDRKILVVGDLMLDRFWWGDVSRISPEAPVPIVRLARTSEAVGGAANVAANIAGLGCTAILVGFVGEDSEGALFSELLEKAAVSTETVLVSSDKPTTVKTRIVANGQHVARVDSESTFGFSSSDELRIVNAILSRISDVAAVILSDYAKGTLSDTVIQKTIEAAIDLGIPVLVDPKGKDLGKYRGATVLTPNKREAADAAGLSYDLVDVVDRAGELILEMFSGMSVVITEGEHGMTLFSPGKTPFHVDSVAREVYDVTGAGDTMVAALAVAMANGADLPDAVGFANTAAGFAVEHVGTTQVTMDMIQQR